MNNLFDAYHDFFDTGDMDKLISSLNSLGHSTDRLRSERKWSIDEVDCIKILALYIEKVGFEYKSKVPSIPGDFYNSIKTSKTYARLTIGNTTISEIKETLLNDYNFNNIEVNSDVVRFDGKFHFNNIDISRFDEYLTAAIHLYLFGLPIDDLEIINKLKNKYITTGMVMQAVMYSEIGSELCDSICNLVNDFYVTVNDWCYRFDGVLFDVSNQICDGFVSIFNPENPTKVICVSTLYFGKYFITNMNAFKELYESDLLSTVRFTNKSVKVQSVVNGKLGDIRERIVEVPVFSDDGEEFLVSDFVNDNYVYNELFLNDVGRI